ncbi:MAG TPA: sigma-54 dependent transcriptional regulator [Rubricoccaceae bacterium]
MLSALIVDDEANIRRVLARCLDDLGVRPTTASTAAGALDESRRTAFDLVFLDLRLGSESGLDVLPQLTALLPKAHVVVVTAYADIETAIASVRLGAADLLPKPFLPEQVALVVDKLSRERALEREVAALRLGQGGAEPVVLESRNAAVGRVLGLAQQAAASDATVLLTGESGTGKSSLARAVHAWSPRAGRPFVTFSAPSGSGDLLESELFGHARGAFTGAITEAPGRVSLADGGTLFLDEIGELPLALQPKLLRFVQERTYERVGDPRPRQADVRLVAATNRDLASEVAAGRFREDLYYRLNVIEVRLPPLRDRPEDVVALSRDLLAHFAARAGRPGLAFTPEAEAALAAHPWPGNLRELRNAVERATILSTGSGVGADLLPFTPDAASAAIRIGDPVPLAAVEEAHVRRVVGSAASLEEAAATLGIDRATLWRRRREYGI